MTCWRACATLDWFQANTTVNSRMPKPLPLKLKKEPLVEAACQLRVSSSVALNTFFPGLVLAKHPADVSNIQQLPTAMIPQQMKDSQPEMAFMPLVQLKFKSVLVLIGERSVTVSNAAPYLGWDRFKPLIEEVFKDLLDSKLIQRVERYSIKYINVLKAGEAPDHLNALDWSLKVGELDLNKNATVLRTETLTDGLATILTISGGVTVQAKDQAPVQGSLIDVDTVCARPQDADTFLASMSSELDRIRGVNKAAFFECLTNEAINGLEPVYE
ncbi:MAG: TIGR04255 family protein [Burkholderiaceae bacterium]|nr:MAG: TIGR04255 family protein [Burkholderiaceae bacterium]TBR75687.1 MAG: TIGR04255 family protein [Burkholderiaceae bacterium]